MSWRIRIRVRLNYRGWGRGQWGPRGLGWSRLLVKGIRIFEQWEAILYIIDNTMFILVISLNCFQECHDVGVTN